MKNNDIIDEKLSSIKNIIKKKNLNEYVGKEEADVKVEEQVLATCDKNIRIIACAGSGKTYLMVKKTISLIEQDKYNLSKIIVTTFTDLAANELKREIYYKIIKKGIYNSDKEAYQNLKKMFIGTIHGLCLKYLKMLEKDEINYNEMNILNESNIKLLIYRYYSNPDLNITKILPFSRKIIRNFGNSNLIIPDYLHMIYKISEETISLKNYKQDENIPSSILNMFDLFSSFILKKKYLTFSLITRKFVDCFKNKDSQMWKLISNIKYLIIDEFQDINPIQQKIVEIFLSNNSYVYVVGDEDQAIYQFRGGSEKFLTDFVKNAESINQNKILDVKKANTRRCTSGIVYLADSIINQNSVHELFSGYRDEKVLKSISPLSDQEGDMTKVVYETEEEEINSVIEQAKSYHDLKGVKYNNIAIILRKNKDVEKFCFELEKKKIPYERKENGGIFDYLGFENEAYKAFTFIIEIRNKKGKFEGYEKKKAKIKNNPYISHSLFEFLENLPDLTFIENVEQIFELNQKYLKNKIYEQENIIHLIQYLQKNKEEKIDNIKKYFLDDKRIPLIIKYKGKHPISFSFYKIFLLLKDISKSYNSYVVSEILQNIFGFVDKEKKEALLSYINKYQNELYKIENIIAKTTKTNHELLYFLKQIIILVNVKDISDKNKYYEFLLNTEQIANIIQDYEEVYQGVGKIQKIYDFIEFLDNANDSYSYLFPESEDDKINVLTAHGSKGLGFYITFLPFLNKDSFPSSISVDEECDKFGCYEKWMKNPKSPEEEEEFSCEKLFEQLFPTESSFHPIDTEVRLFYIAITRSRKYIHFSCNSERNKPSAFFNAIWKEEIVKDCTPSYQNEIYPAMLEKSNDVSEIIVSHTSIEEYTFCPYLFFLMKTNKFLIKKQSNNLSKKVSFENRGILIHKCMELLLSPNTDYLDFYNYSLKIIKEHVEKEYCGENKEEVIKNIHQNIYKLKDEYFNEERMKNTKSEEKFEWFMQNDEKSVIVFKGSIDNIYVDDEKVIITDYKTANWDVNEIKIKKQLIRYALAYVNAIKVFPLLKIKMVALNIDTGKKIEYGYGTTNIIPLSEFEKELLFINQKIEAIKANVFSPCPHNCKTCPYADFCDERR